MNCGPECSDFAELTERFHDDHQQALSVVLALHRQHHEDLGVEEEAEPDDYLVEIPVRKRWIAAKDWRLATICGLQGEALDVYRRCRADLRRLMPWVQEYEWNEVLG